VATRIGQVVMLHRGGDRAEARRRLLLLWAQLGADGDPFQRCTVAHFLAGTQDDPADELAWRLRALSAAGELRGPGTGGAGAEAPALRALLPSLHLGLATAYARLGRTGAARGQLRLARRAARCLGDDGHSTGVRAAIGRLERSLGTGGRGGRP
jgi:hypothetical protein